MAGGAGWLNLPVTLAAAGVTGAAYSPLMRRGITAAMLAERPAAVRAAAAGLAGSGAPVAVPLGDMLLSPPEVEAADRRRRGLLDY